MMKKRLLLSLSFAVCVHAYAEPGITDYKARGNLESTKKVDCVALDKLDNTYTPADIYRGVSKCIDTGEYEKGAHLFAMAGVYGRFDVYRVSDKTAHQGLRVLLINTFGSLSPEKKQAFQKTLHTVFAKDSKSLRATCNSLDSIGHPAYYPRYMIMHGMGAFGANPNQEALVKDFNAKKAWKSALDTYLHCPMK